MNNCYWIISEEDGQGMVEYSLILVLLVLSCIVGLELLGKVTYNLYNVVATKLP
ncbi:hypothetical protein LY60_03503 [Sedimentibacter saalensis]|uniref:Pilus assembly protein Flp/PilA n=1 Tax=Sedimentibacter saalensis TaxID=130788 RepID=A0A562J1L0_9FIRM|nr:hypothetical protein LY60_03503 [Sedimentibacter saalensis]